MRLGLVLALAAIPATALAQPPAPPAVPASPAPPTAEESFARGVQLHQAGDILGAIEAYQDALQQEPQRIDARSNLGAAYVRLGRYEEAVREYRRALEQVLTLEPKQTAALLLLADCRLQTGDDAGVIALLEPREAELGQDRLYSYL